MSMTASAVESAPTPAVGLPLSRPARPRPLSLPAFLDRLQDAIGGTTRADVVEELLASWRPRLESLRPFVRYDPLRYARQRLFRCDAFELILMCWDEGQATPVHDHDGQSGWITVVEGELTVQEYDRLGGPSDLREIRCEEPSEPGLVPLAAAGRLVVPAGSAVAEAAAPEAIHRVGPRLGRALSLHLYAGPLDSFLVFDPATGSARRVRP
jgi:cysteine dioxygenase